jgi:hypothetical protein
MASLQKNVSGQFFTFVTVGSTTGLLTTSTSTTQFNSVAFLTTGTVQAALAGTFTPLTNGQWAYAPTQGETNYAAVGYLFEPASTVPVNIHFFTDQVDANGFLKVDLVDIAGATVAAGSAQLGVNVVNIGGSATVGSAGYVGIDWSQINSPTSTVGFTNTTVGIVTSLSSISATAKSSLVDVLLDRDMSLGLDSGSSSVRTPRTALRVLRNKVDTSSGTTMIVYKEDDTTTSWTASITVSSAASPIVTVTPP